MKKGKGIKIGIIGLGFMGQHYARILSQLPGARLAAVADINPELAKKISEKYQVESSCNYQDILSEAEAFCVASPTSSHFEIASNVIAAGKHLLIEKPFTGSSKLAEKLISLSQEKNTILHVNLIERNNPAFQVLLKLLKNEKIIGINFRRASPFPERITDTNVIFDMMIHDLDLMGQIVDSSDSIEKLKAKGRKVKSKLLDEVAATIYFKSGLICQIEASRIFSIKSRKITAITEKSFIEVDLLKKIVYLREFNSNFPSAIPTKSTDQLTETIKNFIKAIKARETSKTQALSALKTIQLAERIESICS